MNLLKFLNLRKTVKLGPFNVTVSKSGVSASLPVGPGRVRIKSDGTVHMGASQKGLRYGKSFKLNKR